MRALIVISLLLVFNLCAFLHALNPTLDQQWEQFKLQHSKNYRSPISEQLRREIWENNIDFIRKHNEEADAGKQTYWMTVNEYADITRTEFQTKYLGLKRSQIEKKSGRINVTPKLTSIKSIDWREYGYVTSVKNQGDCGSCYAFAIVATLEAQNIRKYRNRLELSEQAIVDCSVALGNLGCEGGSLEQTYEYVMQAGGLPTSVSYPYNATVGKCASKQQFKYARISGYREIISGSEVDLTNAIATVGPVAIAIDASLDSFQFYDRGIYYDRECSSKNINHAVTAVGYGTNVNGIEYYIVKNSWGSKWGENGYVRIIKNRSNHCGVATNAMYPIIS